MQCMRHLSTNLYSSGYSFNRSHSNQTSSSPQTYLTPSAFKFAGQTLSITAQEGTNKHQNTGNQVNDTETDVDSGFSVIRINDNEENQDNVMNEGSTEGVTCITEDKDQGTDLEIAQEMKHLTLNQDKGLTSI